MTSKVLYKGGLRTQATHIKSNNFIQTDAPTDNHGKGALFSPTDLCATSLASCMITVMGIAADARGINIDGTHADIQKVMASEPRRISEIHVDIYMAGQDNFSEKEKDLLEHTGRNCPVAKSLHPNIQQKITFNWP